MAIKIIKNTMVDPIKQECNNCLSIFSFNYDDIKTETVTNVFGLKVVDRYVICPVCKSKVRITRRGEAIDDGATEENNNQ